MKSDQLVIGAIDEETRCNHYHGELDRIAIRFKCCDRFYSCYYCHEEAADHQPAVWQRSEWEEPVILCGTCRSVLTIRDYLSCDSTCPVCRSSFNPKCQYHYPYYFAMAADDQEEVNYVRAAPPESTG